MDQTSQDTHIIHFNFWNDEENRLVKERKLFALAIMFGDYIHVENNIYEYDQILVDVLNLSSDSIHDGMGYRIHNLVKFNVENQFVVVKCDGMCNTHVLGQYASNEEGFNVIMGDCIARVCSKSKETNSKANKYDPDDYVQYVIVNLENTTPYFFGKGKLSETPQNKAGEFYDHTGTKSAE